MTAQSGHPNSPERAARAVPGQDSTGRLDHVLVLAPYRKDSAYISQLLTEQAIECRVCENAETLASALETAPGVLVTTNEAITHDTLAVIARHLIDQPDWSELPIVVLLDRGAPARAIGSELSRQWPRSRQTFYERPVTTVELLSGIQSALLSRLRQRDVRDHVVRETELRRELNHRVKNILASISSIFEMTKREADTVEAMSEKFSGRLDALAQVHAAVFQTEGEGIAIRDIVALTFRPYAIAGDERILAQGPELTLTSESATTLALCLHELTTNAIKYGALSVPEGHVRFVWSLDGAGQITLSWHESGGPRVQKPSRRGYGTRYIESALAGMIGGRPEIAFEPEGLRVEVSGPVSRIIGNE